MDKAQMRTHMKRLLAGLAEEDLRDRSRRVAERFALTAAWAAADTVLCFLSMPHEIRTGTLIASARAAGKRVAVPRIEGDDIRFLVMPGQARGLERDRWGIPVPGSDWPVLDLASSDRMLVAAPGLAFDREGNRLGRGKGYYDRFLVGARAQNPGITTIAVCLSEQLVPAVPHEESDQRLDGIVTENETIVWPKSREGSARS
jgi:5-formyltetrahydrofolate cyclo-ligase